MKKLFDLETLKNMQMQLAEAAAEETVKTAKIETVTIHGLRVSATRRLSMTGKVKDRE